MTEENTVYDVIIIGGGPSGLAASIYSLRYKLKTAIFTNSFGGVMSTAHKVCNYPGFKEISGMDLTNKLIDQAKDLGVELIFESIVNVKKQDEENLFIVESENQTLRSRKVIVSIGQKRRELGIPREKELVGKGVSYCATCDGNFYKDKITAVIGGSDAAVTAALLLADVSTKTYLIYRKDKLRAVPSWVELAKNNPKVEILYNSEVKELIGKDKLEAIKLNTSQELKIDGLFIEIGSIPNKDFVNKLGITSNSKGYIEVDDDQKTNISGIFAAGDCTNKTELKQIITASSQGAIAAYSAYKEIMSDK